MRLGEIGQERAVLDTSTDNSGNLSHFSLSKLEGSDESGY